MGLWLFSAVRAKVLSFCARLTDNCQFPTGRFPCIFLTVLTDKPQSCLFSSGKHVAVLPLHHDQNPYKSCKYQHCHLNKPPTLTLGQVLQKCVSTECFPQPLLQFVQYLPVFFLFFLLLQEWSCCFFSACISFYRTILLHSNQILLVFRISLICQPGETT